MFKTLFLASALAMSAPLTACAVTADHGGADEAAAPHEVAPHAISLERTISVENFDFMEGIWRIDSRHLRRRMRGSTSWVQNDLEGDFTVRLGGYVVMNTNTGTFNGNTMEGFMIRTYDPDTDEWTMRWMSRGYPHLTEQVRGRFADGFGEFFGVEENDGRSFTMRFRWYQLSDGRAYWEQAYQDPDTEEWEINWTMDMHRISGC